MPTIHVLQEHVANQIAAGEVVERPSSIVKELLDNAIDAGATSITLEIREGGIGYIRVSDNGCGMGAEDARMAFLPHATSKIRSVEDLTHVATMGFRGEALPSIASVAQVDLTTRREEDVAGAHIVMRGGELLLEEEIGCPDGTSVTVTNLFYNTPVRLKFLKKPSTEAAYITTAVCRLILSHPDITFRLISNGKMLYHAPGDGDLQHAIYAVYGAEIANALLPIEHSSGALRLSGYVGKTEVSRFNRSLQAVIVNKRPVGNFIVSSAVESAFETRMMTNRFPVFVLHLDMPYELVNVNIHPNKMEVRFRNEAFVRDTVRDAVRRVLEPQHLFDRQADSDAEEAAPPPQPSFVMAGDASLPQKRPGAGPASNGEASSNTVAPGDTRDQALYPTASSAAPGAPGAPHTHVFQKPSQWDGPMRPYSPPGAAGKAAAAMEEMTLLPHDTSPRTFTVIGQLFKTYCLIEYRDNLYMIDQHAAHERILYEKLLDMLKSGQPLSQTLLVPYVLHVSQMEKEVIMEHMDQFSEIGYELEEFGRLAFQVRSVPLILGEPQVGHFFFEALERIERWGKSTDAELKRETLMQLSCKHAVKGGDTLSLAELEMLVITIEREAIPLTCPHGRPIVMSMSRTELEKQFKRIV